MEFRNDDNTEIKVGDKVKLKKDFLKLENTVGMSLKLLKDDRDKIYTIESISIYRFRLLLRFIGGNYYFDARGFEKIEEVYEIGKKYLFSALKNNEYNQRLALNSENLSTLIAYIPESNTPFVTTKSKIDEKKYKNNEKFSIDTFKYAICPPQPKAYKEPKIEWLGRVVVNNSNGEKSSIDKITRDSFNDNILVHLKNKDRLTCKSLFKNYCWEDGSVIGE